MKQNRDSREAHLNPSQRSHRGGALVGEEMESRTSKARLPEALTGKSLLIFDFDGTIADTTPLHSAAFTHILEPLGVAVDYPSIAGFRTREAMLLCLARASLRLPDAQIDELVERKQEAVRKMIAGGLKALPGVDSFLRWAKPRYRLAMATSGSRRTVQMALHALGYSGWFDPLVCAEDIAHSKPHAESFLRVLECTGVDACDSLVFEDSEAGFQAARSAKISCIDAKQDLWRSLGVTQK